MGSMEKLAGAAIFLVGLLIIFFGGASTPKAAHGAPRGWRMPPWIDRTIQWGIGVLSVWFGVQLFFGHAHFF
jgi:hypothetical protein